MMLVTAGPEVNHIMVSTANEHDCSKKIMPLRFTLKKLAKVKTEADIDTMRDSLRAREFSMSLKSGTLGSCPRKLDKLEKSVSQT